MIRSCNSSATDKQRPDKGIWLYHLRSKALISVTAAAISAGDAANATNNTNPPTQTIIYQNQCYSLNNRPLRRSFNSISAQAEQQVWWGNLEFLQGNANNNYQGFGYAFYNQAAPPEDSTMVFNDWGYYAVSSPHKNKVDVLGAFGLDNVNTEYKSTSKTRKPQRWFRGLKHSYILNNGNTCLQPPTPTPTPTPTPL